MQTPGNLELATRLVFGEGSVARLGELAGELGSRHALLVTDAGLVAAGHVERAEAALRAAGVEVRRFADVRQNPTSSDVDACVAFARQGEVDLIIGFGGGSSLDTAKGCNFVLTGGGAMEDYWGVGKAKGPMLPLIAVPTTAGTGSEAQSYALISRDGDHRKMACGDKRAAPVLALLDPELTLTMPQAVTACTGLDTLTHAVETLVATASNDDSKPYSREAFRLAQANFRRVLAEPGDVAARGEMLTAATFAGAAIENSMLGAAHACANPLTARFDLVHGHAVGLMLPHVVRFNAHVPAAAQAYLELAELAGLRPADEVEALALELEGLLRATGLPVTLEDCGVPAAALPELAAEAAGQWTAGFNPRPVGEAELLTLLSSAHGGAA